MRSCRKIKKEARELADKATSPASSSTQTTSGKKGRPTKKIARRLFDSDSYSEMLVEDSSSDENCEQFRTPAAGTILNVAEKPNTFVATPQKFGMPVWSEVECTFLEHLMHCDMGLEHAKQKGIKLPELQNLLLLTLPRDYKFVAAYMTDDDKSTLEKFRSKLMELIMGTNWDQTAVAMNAHRQPNEKILSFLLRVANTYKFSIGAQDADLENDAGFCNMMYSRIMESLPVIAKAEFQRGCEQKLKSGNFKFADLKNEVIQIARKLPGLEGAAAKICSIGGQGQGIMTSQGDAAGSAGNIAVMSDNQKRTRKETRSCFFCKQPGHLKKDCYKFKKYLAKRQTTEGSDISKNREPKDSKDGRHQTA